MKGLEDAGFDLIAANGLVVVATALITRTEATKTVLARHDESGAAGTALRQTREEVLRTPRADGISCGPNGFAAVLLAVLRKLPHLVGHDAQLRDFLPHPLGRRVPTRHALSGVGILHVAQTVPHQPTDVQFVVQNPRTAFGVPVDCARAPGAAERAGNAFAIQVLGDLLRRDASNEVPEDPSDDSGFVRLDFAFAGGHAPGVQCLDDTIAIAEAAGRLAILDASAQSAMCLLGEILQEQSVHRALESDVQVRDVAFGERDDVDAGEGETLEEARRVFLVAAEAVQRLGEHDVEPTIQRVPHQRLKSGAQQRSTRDRVIRELLHDCPALASRELAADAQLIGDRRVALVVGGVPSVHRNLHCTVTSGRSCRCVASSRAKSSRAA